MPASGTVSVERVRLASGLAINCASAGKGEPVLLLHGWPQTHHAWRHVIAHLSRHHRVIAPDLPGFGASSRPSSGYDKKTIAGMLHELMAKLGHARFDLVGHDVGGQIVYPLAAMFPDAVRSLCFVEAGIPGLGDKDDAANPWRGGSWHFGFNMLADLPEALVAGRERAYLHFLFFRDTIGLHVTDAIGPDDLDIYVQALSRPGGLRSSFAHYRALMQDRGDNRALAAAGKLAMPVLIAGAEHGIGLSWRDTVAAVADDIEAELIKGSGHYLPEERPDALSDLLLSFFERTRSRQKGKP